MEYVTVFENQSKSLILQHFIWIFNWDFFLWFSLFMSVFFGELLLFVLVWGALFVFVVLGFSPQFSTARPPNEWSQINVYTLFAVLLCYVVLCTAAVAYTL